MASDCIYFVKKKKDFKKVSSEKSALIIHLKEPTYRVESFVNDIMQTYADISILFAHKTHTDGFNPNVDFPLQCFPNAT